jgi:DNA polymerase III epsilon subunit-like protein
MSIHHITNEMVKNRPYFKNSKTWKQLTELFEDTDNIMVAHNAMFPCNTASFGIHLVQSWI